VSNHRYCDTFTATIYVGFREAYSDVVHTLDEARAICQEITDRGGLCVSLTPTEFVYKNGSEPGVIVGLINYPRFPKMHCEIKEQAIELAEKLKTAMRQERVSIVCSDETIMLEGSDEDE
jgi:hypothetical protein